MRRMTTFLCAMLMVCTGAFPQEQQTMSVKVSVDPIELSDALNAAIRQDGGEDRVSVRPDPANSSIIISGTMELVELVDFIRGLEAGELRLQDIPAAAAPVLWLYDMEMPGGSQRVSLRNVDHEELGAVLRDVMADAARQGANVRVSIPEVTDDYIVFAGDEGEIDEIVDVLHRLDDGDPISEHAGEEQLERIRAVFEEGVDLELSFGPETVSGRALFEALDESKATRGDDPVVEVEFDGEMLFISGRNFEVERLYEVLSLLDSGESVEWRKAQDYQPVVDLFLEARKPVSRIIKLKHGVTPKVHELVELYARGNSGGDIRINLSDSLGWIRIQGPPRQADEFEQLISEIDTPPVNVELTFYLLMSGGSPNGDVPEPIVLAVTRIQETFGLDSLSLLDVAMLRGADGRVMNLETVLPLSELNRNTGEQRYENGYLEISVKRVSASKDAGVDMFSLDEVDVRVQMDKYFERYNEFRAAGAEMFSSLDIREGQSVVLGKSNFDNADRALFVIVQARRAD